MSASDYLDRNDAPARVHRYDRLAAREVIQVRVVPFADASIPVFRADKNNPGTGVEQK